MQLVQLVGRIHWLKPLPVIGIRLDSRRAAKVANVVAVVVVVAVIAAVVVVKVVVR
jgi:hypothetical protein